MDLKKDLMQKNGLMAMELAKEFLQVNAGERICTVAELAEKYNTARGTIQSALKYLQEVNGITLKARGHLGTFIEEINYTKLLEVADIKNIVGVMPLPYSKLYEGLATGIYTSTFSNTFHLNIAYMRGSKNRMEMLRDGRYDFAIMSMLAAEEHIRQGENIEIAIDFGPKSYVNEHIILFNDKDAKEITDGMVVGIDESSVDHKLLTNYLCSGKKVTLKKVLYSQILKKITDKEIDAAIWNIDVIMDLKLNLNYRKLKEDEFTLKDTSTVIVVSKKNNYLKKLISRFIDKERTLKIQKQVISGEIDPSY